MTLSTHAVVGAAIAVALPGQPILGASLAFVSHFLLDSLPHWDYKILSQSANPEQASLSVFRFEKLFFIDLFRIGSDVVLGLILTLLIFGVVTPQSLALACIGAAAAMLPDFLQFVYRLYPLGPFAVLQRFHVWIHTEHRLVDQPFLGITSQACVAGIIVAAFQFFLF